MSWNGAVGAIGRDVRFAARILRRRPLPALLTILTLALAIGANSAIFSIMDGLLLRSLPVRDPQRLMLLEWHAHHGPKVHSSSSYGDCASAWGGGESHACSFSLPLYQQLRRQSTGFSGLAAFAGAGQVELSGAGQASVARAQWVSGNYFSTLGVAPAIGRLLEPADDRPGAPPAAVLNYSYWMRGFGGSPAVVGKAVSLNGVPAVIVGVAARSFTSLTPGGVYDLWVPIAARPALTPRWNPARMDAGSIWLVLVGRLQPGVSVARAQAELDTTYRAAMFAGAKPLQQPADDPHATLVAAQTGLTGARQQYSHPLSILMFAVGFILLIACANIGGLQLARAQTRRQEMALRLALGSGRAGLVRQLLAESVLLAGLGGSLGVVIAWIGARAIVNMVASGTTRPTGLSATLDGRVLLFTAVVAIASGLLFGLAPASAGLRLDLNASLKDAVGNSTGRARRRWLPGLGSILAAAQVALCVIVLIGAGLLVRTLRNLQSVDPGFDTHNVLLFGLDATLGGYKGAAVDNLNGRVQARLAALPGVLGVSYGADALLSDSLWTSDIVLPGRPGQHLESDWQAVGTDFFSTMRIPLLAGRDFNSTDFATAAAAQPATPGGPPPAGAPATPVIVNRAFVEKFLAGRNPLGRTFNYPGQPGEPQGPGFTIVGVAADSKYNNLRREIQPTTYQPLVAIGVEFAVRTAGSPTALLPSVRGAVRDIDPNLPLIHVSTQAETIDRLLAQERIVSRLAGVFGLLALLLACTGLFGLLSHEVGRRTREIGIRMALGARRANIIAAVLRSGLAIAVTGLCAGTIAALGLTRYLTSILYGVKPADLPTLAAVGLLLVAVALVACYLPARRAAGVNPLDALRAE